MTHGGAQRDAGPEALGDGAGLRGQLGQRVGVVAGAAEGVAVEAVEGETDRGEGLGVLLGLHLAVRAGPGPVLDADRLHVVGAEVLYRPLVHAVGNFLAAWAITADAAVTIRAVSVAHDAPSGVTTPGERMRTGVGSMSKRFQWPREFDQ
jgi:hypothetical protein